MNGHDPRGSRNGALIDRWSYVHIASSAILTLLIGPFWAFVIVVLWEPLEILVLSPFLAKFGIVFGHETIRNSMSDIVFDAVGVGIAMLLLHVF